MKVSFDLHGVLNDLPDVFQFLTEAIIDKGGEVHIITGSTTEKALLELEELGFKEGLNFTKVVGLPNYLEDLGCVSIGVNRQFGNLEYSDTDWNSAKGYYCKQNEINLHFDDTLEYGEYFLTPFARLWTKNK